MMKSLFLLTGLIAGMSVPCQSRSTGLNLKCLSTTENEYPEQLYSVFEKKLKDRYGELKSHELIYEYVNDLNGVCHVSPVFTAASASVQSIKIYIL